MSPAYVKEFEASPPKALVRLHITVLLSQLQAVCASLMQQWVAALCMFVYLLSVCLQIHAQVRKTV